MAASRLTLWKRTDFAWLGLAVGIHCALLLLPLRQAQFPLDPTTVASNAALTVELMPFPVSTMQAQLEIPPPMDATASALPVPSKLDAAPANQMSSEADPGSPDETANKDLERMSAARLIDLVSQMSFTDLPSPATRKLGSIEHSQQISPWRTGGGAGAFMAERNAFEGMMAPARTEIIDRWQAADGSQNIVINTRSGETLCGRGEAWDPMRPLVEHVMMFRSCGSGGKRTFTMAAREKP